MIFGYKLFDKEYFDFNNSWIIYQSILHITTKDK